MSDGITRRDVLRSGALVGAASVAGCTGDGGGDGSGGGTTVTMPGVEFSPRVLEVEAGTEVTWRNTGGTEHTVVSTQLGDAGESWEFDQRVPPDDAVSHRFDAAGSYGYLCDVHGESSMCGVVVVGGGSYGGSLPCAGGGGGAY